MIRLLTLSLVVVAVLGCGGGTVTVGGAGGGDGAVGGGDGATGGGDGTTGGGSATTGGGSATTGGGTATTGGGAATTGGGTAATGGGTGTTGGGTATTGGGTATTGGGTATTGGGAATSGGGTGTTGGGTATSGGGTGTSGGGTATAGGGTGTTGGGTATSGGGTGTTGGGTGTTGGGTGTTGGGTGTLGGGTGTLGGGTGTAGGGTSCTPVTTELLTNGDLEAGPGTEWVEGSTNGYELITTSSSRSPQSGAYLAWLGGATSNNDYLDQTVVVPANTTSLVITGYYAIGTLENANTTIKYDHVYFDIYDTSYNLQETLLHYSNVDHVSTWTPFTLTATLPYSGQSVIISMNSTNDNSGSTSFYFDSLSVKATHCP